MQYFEIIVYSFIQGLTEFFPVSSSAHLYFLEYLFKWEIEGLTYALAAHLGTLIAVLMLEKRNVLKISKEVFSKNVSNNSFILLGTCVIPVLIVGFFIILFFQQSYKFGITAIALTSIIGAICLDISDKYFLKYKKDKTLSFRDSIYIGLFQTLSLIPGMSRSGTVITAARFLGYSRSYSTQLALLTSIPIIFFSSCFGLYKVFLSNQFINLNFVFIVLITFICAFISIKFLVRWVKYFSFRIFVIYRIFFGILLLCLINANL